MIRTITLILIMSCFTINANAISTKEVITKIPAFLLLAAIQLPSAMCKSMSNVDSNTDINQINSSSNITLAEILQHLITMQQDILKIKQKVDAPSDYMVDKLLGLGISAVALLGIGAFVLILCICDKCSKRSNKNILSNATTRYGF